MRDAFANFADALFNMSLREITARKLQESGVCSTEQELPATLEERVVAIEKLQPKSLLELIYRYQFLSSERDFDAIHDYVRNAPLNDQYVHEFIQNAEDAGAQFCTFGLHNDHIVVRNDGQGFSNRNLFAICSYRESDKDGRHRQRYIGKFGVGFKSVFRVCSSPLIVTWDRDLRRSLTFRFFAPGMIGDRSGAVLDDITAYHWKLDKDSPLRFSEQVGDHQRRSFHSQIGYLFPVPVALPTGLQEIAEREAESSPSGSLFYLPIEEKEARALATHFDRWVDPRSFLFLQLKKLEACDHLAATPRVLTWEKRIAKSSPRGVEKLCCEATAEGVVPPQPLEYLRLATQFQLGTQRQALKNLDEKARQLLREDCTVTLVLPLDNGRIAEPTPLQGELFNGLHVRGVATGLHFHIDAPFNLTGDRNNILQDSFDEWLMSRIAAAAGKLLNRLRKDSSLGQDIYRLVPADRTYGQPGQAAEVSQRLKAVHEQLQRTAAQLGVLPALGEGLPLRLKEALVLSGAWTHKAVSDALHRLFGGLPADLFEQLSEKWKGTTVRFCLLPKGTHLEKLVDLWKEKVIRFTPEWITRVLPNANAMTVVKQRDTRWVEDLLLCMCRTPASQDRTKVEKLDWVPATNGGCLSPFSAYLFPNAPAEDLALLSELASVFPADGQPDWNLADVEFTNRLLAFERGLKAEDRLRICELFPEPRRLSWSKILARICRQPPLSLGENLDPTPEVVLRVVRRAFERDGKAVLPVEDLRSRLVLRVRLAGANDPAAWPLVWLSTDGVAELPTLPERDRELIPRHALSDDWREVLSHLLPKLPSARGVRFVLDRIGQPLPETAAWALAIWREWTKTTEGPGTLRRPIDPRLSDGREAIQRLQVRVRGGNAKRLSLGNLFPEGFGEAGEGLDEGLIVLFGSRAADLEEYGDRFTQKDFKDIRIGPGPGSPGRACFFPSLEDVESAVKKLEAPENVDQFASLAVAMAVFLVRCWGGLEPSVKQGVSDLLNQSPWLPCVGAAGRARPRDLLLVEDAELRALLGGTLGVLVVPPGEQGAEFGRALRDLQKRAAVHFIVPDSLDLRQQQDLIAHLRQRIAECREANDPRAWRAWVRLVGRLLREGWVFEVKDVDELRQEVDLGALPLRTPACDGVWVLHKPTARVPGVIDTRGLIAVTTSDEADLRGLQWATQGFTLSDVQPEQAVYQLIDSDANFARRFLVALGQATSPGKEPLNELEQRFVVRVYMALATKHQERFSKVPEDCPVVLTEAGCLRPASEILVAHESMFQDRLADLVPERCLSKRVRDLRIDILECVEKELKLCRVHSADLRPSEEVLPLQPRGEYPEQVSRESCLTRVLQLMWPSDLTDPFPTESENWPIQIVDDITRKRWLVIADWKSAPREDHLDLWADQPKCLFFLSLKGRAKLEHELLRLSDEANATEQSRLVAEFDNEVKKGQQELEELRTELQADALGYYRLSVYDPEFVAQDRWRDPPENRWKVFLDLGHRHHRLSSLIKKLTVDLGYGADTVVRELLQNIDDAYLNMCDPPEVPWVEFTCGAKRLIVTHNGRRFNDKDNNGQQPKDVRGICSLGAGSDKPEQFQIGKFGLGFKSVYALTSEPVILSHPYYFRITHLVVPDTAHPFQLPELQGEGYKDWLCNRLRTRFVLAPSTEDPQKALDQKKALVDITSWLKGGDNLRGLDLLFLRHLRKAVIRIEGFERPWEVTRVDSPLDLVSTGKLLGEPIVEITGAGVRQVCETPARKGPATTAYAVVTARTEAPVPTALGHVWKSLECAAAFPWDPQKGCFAMTAAEADGYLFLFLPTREHTGLPFHVYGQFLTNLGRTDINGEHECNKHLAVALANVVRTTLWAAFKRWQGEPVKLRSIYRAAPAPAADGWARQHWLDVVRRVFLLFLEGAERVVLTREGRLVEPESCRLASPLVHTLYARLGADTWLKRGLPALVDPEVADDIRRIQRRAEHVKQLTVGELADALFTEERLSTDAASTITKECATILQQLFWLHQEKCSEDERRQLLSRLSERPCFATTMGRIGRPLDLVPTTDARPEDGEDRAHLYAITEGVEQFTNWVLRGLRWAPPPRKPREVFDPQWGRKIEETYLPFPPEILKQHFADVAGSNLDPNRHLQYYLASAYRYQRFITDTGQRSWQGRPLSELKNPCQIEKDERFWLVTCLMRFYHHPDRLKLFRLLLEKCFGKSPPCDLPSWKDCLTGDLKLYFEVNLPSPENYKSWLRNKMNLNQRQIVPFVREAAQRPDSDEVRDRLEGATHADALLLNRDPKKGFAVLFEAKVLSDISNQITFDTLRNQVARSIDVLLDKNSELLGGLSMREPQRSLFVLLTPRLFKESPGSRLYDSLLREYLNVEPDHQRHALERDLPHRTGQGIDWIRVAQRIGWLTWEDCQLITPWATGRLSQSLSLRPDEQRPAELPDI